ncbi:MAG: hypothetical protein A2Z29_06335 [Chloroflexi bacterium RBG_16_56_11]|nr:MAG: hypothetical protein A2Z29_06335 [Chloroflexi bacterium RBG_16_56_11]
MNKKSKLVEVYCARNEMEAHVIRGLLESFDIPSVMKSNAAPSVHMFTMDGMAEVKIMVMDSMADEARQLLAGEKNV